jgi:alpha-glucosidase (family GH31 glycosyl hydrolase)
VEDQKRILETINRWKYWNKKPMVDIPAQFQFSAKGKADPNAIVQAPGARITLLSSRLVRIEFSKEDDFEDRPSQIFWFRQQPVPHFKVERTENLVEIQTEYLHIRYKPSEPYEAFTPTNLTIVLKKTGQVWEYGMEDHKNLRGTLRTLDTIDGSSPLESGLISRSGWSVIDDTRGLVFNTQRWLEARNTSDSYKDLYFFGYGSDYQTCIQDYFKVSGSPGLVPRWALGNWWSRYWEYSDQELKDLLLDFQAHAIPLSVCIIDMDWHITKTGNQSSGWTGYTWNTELFPDPHGIVKFIHDQGLKTGLNLHPAMGIFPHEEMYAQMALAIGIDPTSENPVPFEPENPDFVLPYFKYLHHPQEEDVGIDFWWMDWQQGNPSKLPGLNLLWWINHIHYFDLGRDRRKRPFIFSRWGGLGNHRYPIGFSGDTVISWDTLAFQPYLTATAANVGFGWWSHDIGGHMGGITDSELYTRWVQLGLFSPILRLHSTKNPFLERRPWGYDLDTYEVVKEAMQLRHVMTPYLYSMAWRDHSKGIQLVRPMYHEHPEKDQAYTCSNQYIFGSELIAAPFITPMDLDVGLARQVIWIPKGTWFNYFDGNCVPVEDEAGKWMVVYGNLQDIPVFAKAGAIIPLDSSPTWGGLRIPDELTLRVFAGADNTFELYEDDGESSYFQDGAFTISRFTQQWKATEAGKYNLLFTIHPAEGETSILPIKRKINFEFFGIGKFDKVNILRNGKLVIDVSAQTSSDNTLKLAEVYLGTDETVIVEILGIDGNPIFPTAQEAKSIEFTGLLKAFRLDNNIKSLLQFHISDIINDIHQLALFKMSLNPNQLRAILELLTESGLEFISCTGEDRLVIWNNLDNPDCKWMYTAEQISWGNPADRYRVVQGKAPKFAAIDPKADLEIILRDRKVKLGGMVQFDYSSLLRGEINFNPRSKDDKNGIGWHR